MNASLERAPPSNKRSPLRTQNYMCAPGAHPSKCSNLICFFDCEVISDLDLFQDIILLNPCFMFPKHLMLSFIDTVTTET